VFHGGTIMKDQQRLFDWAAFILISGLTICSGMQEGPEMISLSGTWGFRLDADSVGETEQWYRQTFADTIQIPGSLQEQNYGWNVVVSTGWTGDIVDRSWFTEKIYEKYRQPGQIKLPFWLTPVKHYVGEAWYQRMIEIPESWRNRSVTLCLERAHWETTCWIDEKRIGSRNSLSTAHIYELGELKPGRHRLTVRVDNRVKIKIGMNAHSISDHTQTNWNGLIGSIEIRAHRPVTIDDLQLYPDIDNRSVKVSVTFVRESDSIREGLCTLQAESNDPDRMAAPLKQVKVALLGTRTHVDINYPMGDDVMLWDEFHPNLYRLHVKIITTELMDQQIVEFGMREFAAAGTHFTVNHQITFLRGTLECCIFPLTGYPPMDVNAWKRIIGIVKDHGLNHIRFHSWCPPEAAFAAADELGCYLQVECASWANQGAAIGDGKPVDTFIYAEGDRILKLYGNHPSFCMLAYGNEPAGENQKSYLGKLLNYWKQKDTRHVYTGAAGWPIIPENQYHSDSEPRIHHWGENLNCRLNAKPPNTTADYRYFVNRFTVPVVSHEIGQWCVFPNFREIPKYSGVLRAANFEIFRDFLEMNHMLDQADRFFMASGKLQAICYKEEIESALRTPGMGGFQLLQLHDFPGQGTALVGILDAFWEKKDYITDEDFHRFSCETVPLARMKKRVWAATETFEADLEIAHFGDVPLEKARPVWTITDAEGEPVDGGRFQSVTIPLGNCLTLGHIQVPLQEIKSAQKLILAFSIEGTDYSNNWEFWVYPEVKDPSPGELIVTNRLTAEISNKLQKGARVLLNLNGQIRDGKGAEVAVGFSSVFWNTAWTNGQAPHTLGILCDPENPVFADFPTEFHSNWQWWDIISKSQAMNLADFPDRMRPLIQLIDTWFESRRLGILFEVRVGNGRICVSSIDFEHDLENRPSARLFYGSLIRYMKSDRFNPAFEAEINQVNQLVE
jgi:hypothetical protein